VIIYCRLLSGIRRRDHSGACGVGPVPVATGPALIRTRRPDRREWNVGRPETSGVITCVLYTDGSRQETDLVVSAADAPLVTGYLNDWPGHRS
jgi:hypothetical protein